MPSSLSRFLHSAHILFFHIPKLAGNHHTLLAAHFILETSYYPFLLLLYKNSSIPTLIDSKHTYQIKRTDQYYIHSQNALHTNKQESRSQGKDWANGTTTRAAGPAHNWPSASSIPFDAAQLLALEFRTIGRLGAFLSPTHAVRLERSLSLPRYLG